MAGSPTNPFDRGPAEAAEYDAWYDTRRGHAVLQIEQRCVRGLLQGAPRPWLDLGTGSGRFGGGLRADLGLDPALDLLKIASKRMPRVVCGVAEMLPVRSASIGTVLAVAVFEFLAGPAEATREVARVLRPGGDFVLGFFPRGGPWAAAYEKRARDPQSVFHNARFLSITDVQTLAAESGLRPTGARSALFEDPDGSQGDRVAIGADAMAGFVAIKLTKPTQKERHPYE